MAQPNQIDVYLSDAFGFFTHAAKANEFPLAPGTYNVPYGALLVAPGMDSVPAGHWPFKTGDAWTPVEDHRADDLYRTDTGEKYELGQTIAFDGAGVCYVGAGALPAWLTNIAPPAAGATWENGAWVPPAGETSQ
ncbi:phage tail protein [Achromobacter aloeverae]